ncbi:DUF4199 domain-containing protein [Hymenobacter sp. BT770]|uniref:DUF4199 domain-containing protein n=1 Tax=Hymenobacter sp. BT770 TaxID=2886942 RepID=UPI001D11CE7A|nr:DUF4199 domain-containing protein [Hymenobacter sp. BT770]MCC3154707.1 DUF4199 domain-containing protein [Hymenobacter sp. BT770]MDO3416761.1 DUF4199 domain-containing protein [Hymenobacter sp. BT770]
METNATPVTTASVGMRYGLLTGLISIIVSFGLFAAHMEQSPLRFISFLVLAGGMVMAMRYYKENNHGFMRFGEGLGIGTILSAVVGALSAIFSYVYMNIIDPEVVGRMMEKARTDMEARGGLSDEQIDQGMAMAGKFMNGPIMLVGVVLGTVFFGVLLALVISAFLKHSKPEFE